MLDRADSRGRPWRAPGCSSSIVLACRLIGAAHDLRLLNVAPRHRAPLLCTHLAWVRAATDSLVRQAHEAQSNTAEA
jgi:hypothetical protein